MPDQNLSIGCITHCLLQALLILYPAVSLARYPHPHRTMNNRREQVGWYFYDWANSAFYTTVVTVFLGPYLTDVAKAAAEAAGEGNTFIYPLGIKVFYGSFFPYVVALSVGLQLLFLPILGAIADYSHRKKQ